MLDKYFEYKKQIFWSKSFELLLFNDGIHYVLNLLFVRWCWSEKGFFEFGACLQLQ